MPAWKWVRPGLQCLPVAGFPACHHFLPAAPVAHLRHHSPPPVLKSFLCTLTSLKLLLVLPLSLWFLLSFCHPSYLVFLRNQSLASYPLYTISQSVPIASTSKQLLPMPHFILSISLCVRFWDIWVKSTKELIQGERPSWGIFVRTFGASTWDRVGVCAGEST